MNSIDDENFHDDNEEQSEFDEWRENDDARRAREYKSDLGRAY
jgi:hypothetical protein